MYLLPCPQCGNSLTVAPSKAGETLACNACKASVSVPKLGDLRQLPRAEEPSDAPTTLKNSQEKAPAAQTGFMFAGLLAVVCFLVASYCGLRWGLLPVPNSTETHLRSTAEDMKSFTAAELIRAYEEMEKEPIDLVLPYQYKEKENIRNRWGMNAVYSGSAGFAALVVAVFIASAGKKRR